MPETLPEAARTSSDVTEDVVNKVSTETETAATLSLNDQETPGSNKMF